MPKRVAAKQITQEERDRIEAIYVPARLIELELDPVRGNFNAAHLKEINRRIFQDLPAHGLDDVRPGSYRDPVPAGKDWIKNRQLESIGITSHVAYSNMDAPAIKQLDATLAGIDIPRWRALKTAEFTKVFANLYTELDHIHPFPDGNSRTLRAFTRQLGEACGYHIDWARFNRGAAGRDMLYIARDLSVNILALPHIKNDDTRRSVTFTLDQLGNNRPLPDLLRDAVIPGRAVAFAKLPQDKALLVFPELRQAYSTLDKASTYAAMRSPGNKAAQQELLEGVRAAIQQKLDKGETTNFGPKATQEKPSKSRGRER